MNTDSSLFQRTVSCAVFHHCWLFENHSKNILYFKYKLLDSRSEQLSSICYSTFSNIRSPIKKH